MFCHLSLRLFLGVEMFHQMLDRAEAGDQLGALIRGLKRDEVRRGHIVAKPGTVNMFNKFMAQVLRASSLIRNVIL